MVVRCEDCEFKLPDALHAKDGVRQVNHCFICGTEVTDL